MVANIILAFGEISKFLPNVLLRTPMSKSISNKYNHKNIEVGPHLNKKIKYDEDIFNSGEISILL